jgi:hypothetical protein
MAKIRRPTTTPSCAQFNDLNAPAIRIAARRAGDFGAGCAR